MSWIVSGSLENVKHAAKILNMAGLVAFPTETVYGLGASVFSEKALLNVFAFKGRPFSDPLIVHISKSDQVHEVALLPTSVAEIFSILTTEFWPGPLTLILPAHPKLNPLVNANTSSVAVRMPNHPLALALLTEAGVPVAAPSANRFGHVSPTLASHVWDDFSENEVCILDGGQTHVGVESTVLKISESEIVLMRKGPIGFGAIQEVLKNHKNNLRFSEVCRTLQKNDVQVQESPGQLLSHYAPEIPCRVLPKSVLSMEQIDKAALLNLGCRLNAVIMIDFGAKYSNASSLFGGYFDLSVRADPVEALFNAFALLREAEKIKLCSIILLPNFEATADEKLLALSDRFLRASSGRTLV